MGWLTYSSGDSIFAKDILGINSAWFMTTLSRRQLYRGWRHSFMTEFIRGQDSSDNTFTTDDGDGYLFTQWSIKHEHSCAIHRCHYPRNSIPIACAVLRRFGHSRRIVAPYGSPDHSRQRRARSSSQRQRVPTATP
jgi:hypothetical protein